MKYLSMFSGIGGFEIGIHNAWESRQSRQVGTLPHQSNAEGYGQDEQYPSCVGYSEIDKYAIKTYEEHFDHDNYGDATKINPRELPDFDLLVGGFPCQAFSVAGKRLGFNDTRGTLFFDIARILAEKRPRHLVLENVKGILSHDSGKTFQTIIGVLTDLGYFVEWQVLNSKDFGVPQNRERIYFVGHLGGEPRRKVFPITGTDSKDIIVSGVLDTETWRKRHEQIRRVHSVDGLSPTIPTGTGGGVMTKIVAPVLTPNRPEKRQNGRRIKNDGEPSFTLTGQDIHGVQVDTRIRRLTPLECERLQGFPDNWTIGSDTQRYKQCGNAVTVNVVAAVIGALV